MLCYIVVVFDLKNIQAFTTTKSWHVEPPKAAIQPKPPPLADICALATTHLFSYM